MKRLLFTGSFDPFTTGHADIASRAATMAEEVIIAVGFNETKTEALASAICRVDEINAWARRQNLYPRVKAMQMPGAAAAFASSHGCEAIIRGVRNSADFLYEYNMACLNRKISGIETILLPTDPSLSYVSSSAVREMRHFGIDTTEFIP